MNDEVNEGEDLLAPVDMTVRVPGRLAQEVQVLVATGVYLSPEEVLRTWLGTGWRFEAGCHHTLRLEIGRGSRVGSADAANPDGTTAEASEA